MTLDEGTRDNTHLLPMILASCSVETSRLEDSCLGTTGRQQLWQFSPRYLSTPSITSFSRSSLKANLGSLFLGKTLTIPFNVCTRLLLLLGTMADVTLCCGLGGDLPHLIHLASGSLLCICTSKVKKLNLGTRTAGEVPLVHFGGQCMSRGLEQFPFLS